MARPQLDAASREGPDRLRRIDQVMEIVSIAMFPLGLTALLLGWFGVASNGHVFLQLPYLISGGLLGVGLLVVGGLLYLASWVSRTSAAQRQQNDELLRAVTNLQRTMAASSVASAHGDTASVANGSSPEHFVATPRGSMFHRPDCAVVTGREDVRTVEPEDAEAMKPCGMCDPLTDDLAEDPADDTTVVPTVN